VGLEESKKLSFGVGAKLVQRQVAEGESLELAERLSREKRKQVSKDFPYRAE